MEITQIEKLNQLISRTDMTGNQKVNWLTNFIDEYVTEQLRLNDVSNRRLLIDFCSKVEETLEMYGHLAPNEAYIDEYLKGN